MIKKILTVCLLLFLSLCPLLSCTRNSHKTITLAGSTAFQPFAEVLAEEYLKTNKDVHINVQGGGSAVGIQSALYGIAEIGMADLLKLPKEADELNSTVIARDGIAIIVNINNAISSLTAKEAHDIFSGEIKNWREVGGRDGLIHVISREDGSGTRKSFDQLVLQGAPLTKDALFQDSNGTVRAAVINDDMAVGYISLSLINDNVRAVKYDGISPSNDNVKKGSYKLARPIFFLTKGEPKPYVKEFMDYVLSDESQAMLEKEGLIGVR